jgi:hypothetical protein
MNYLLSPSRHLAGGTEENHEQPIRMAAIWAEIRNQDPRNKALTTTLQRLD